MPWGNYWPVCAVYTGEALVCVHTSQICCSVSVVTERAIKWTCENDMQGYSAGADIKAEIVKHTNERRGKKWKQMVEKKEKWLEQVWEILKKGGSGCSYIKEFWRNPGKTKQVWVKAL